MKTIYTLLLSLIALPLLACKGPVYACDLFAGNDCTVVPDDIYEVPAPKQPVTTWTELSHHLYFHSKITPGFRVENSALKEFKTQAVACHYSLVDPRKQLVSVEGELEGFRVDEDGIWCFDYFGTQLLKFVRANDIAEEKVDLSLFPLELELSLPAGGVTPSVRRSIQLHLSGWQP